MTNYFCCPVKNKLYTGHHLFNVQICLAAFSRDLPLPFAQRVICPPAIHIHLNYMSRFHAMLLYVRAHIENLSRTLHKTGANNYLPDSNLQHMLQSTPL